MYFHLESDFTWPNGGRDSLEDVYLRSPEKEDMLPRVYLEPQQADLPEVVQGSIHFSERPVSHNSAMLQTLIALVLFGLCGSAVMEFPLPTVFWLLEDNVCFEKGVWSRGSTKSQNILSICKTHL